MSTVRKVISHGGPMHQDDLFAVILALGANPGADWERRDPSLAELADPTVWVIDVGGQHDPDRGNFDHHQLSQANTRCSAHLVLSALGLPEGNLWTTLMGVQDTQGPNAAAEEIRCSVTGYMAAKGPWVGLLTSLVGSSVVVDDSVVDMFRKMGTSYIAEQKFLAERLDMLRHITCPVIGKFLVLDMRGFEKPTTGIREAFPRNAPQLVIVDDMRGPGCVISANSNIAGTPNLYRWANDPRVGFAHKGGFMLTLKGGVDPFEFIRGITPSDPPLRVE